MKIAHIAVWTDYKRVVLDTEGNVWESLRNYETGDWVGLVLKTWAPWKKVEIGEV